MNKKLRLAMGLGICFAVGSTSLAFAYEHYHMHYPYVYNTAAVRALPSGSVRVVVSGQTCYYAGGYFYKPKGRRYVMTTPPPGIIVEELPPSYETVYVNGVAHYRCDGVYYRPALTETGYVIVDPAVVAVPVPAPAPQAVQAPAPPVTPGPVDDKLTINIPNHRGGYTAVVLQRTPRGGFVGPQGEYYPECPSVEQLRLMYGR